MNPYVHDDECTGLAAQTAFGVIAIPYCTPECLFRAWALTERIQK